jgi:dihydrodipicolinate synthase/N-acetylneuraminate lyase
LTDLSRIASRKLTSETLHGVWAALIIPWTNRDELDEARFIAEVDAYSGTGVHGVYTGGTTGEFYAQDDAIFNAVTIIACSRAHLAGLPVQIGCTALSTRIARRRIRHAVACGADAIQIALPFWLQLRPEEAIDFLADAADAAGDVPLVLYQTRRAKLLLTPLDLASAVSRVPTLIGMKYTGGGVDELRSYLTAAPQLSIFGSEHDLLEKMRAGGRGTYSSIAGLNPWRVVEMYNLENIGDLERAEVIQKEIDVLMQIVLPMVQQEGIYDSAIDRVLREVGGLSCVGLRCQPPYRAASEDHVRRVAQWLGKRAPNLLSPRAGSILH